MLRKESPAPPTAVKVALAAVLLSGCVIATLGALMVAVRIVAGGEADFREFFERHRADLEQVAELVASNELVAPDGQSYYGPYLPDDLRYLSATDRVSIQTDGSFFIPRWTGIPDDAGGYWHSGNSPEGLDMYGMVCTDPIGLGGEWWACGIG